MSFAAPAKPRPLSDNDLADVLQLSTLAGWNQTADDWRMLLQLAPAGCFGIEVDGRIVASASLLTYGAQLGWIGMVLTHPEYRHRGLARSLFEHVLSLADSLQVQTLKLDATDQGQPLYESYGFRVEQQIERWSGAGHYDNCDLGTAEAHTENFVELDRQAFGADRSELLRALAGRGGFFSGDEAYALVRPGRVASYLGPCIASTVNSARGVLREALSRTDAANWFWDLLPSNISAVELARELGFSPQRRLLRMARGAEMAKDDQRVFAIAGFELG
jgi:GNAT superfamily N-acetyltransferase